MTYNASADVWYQFFSQSGPQWWILVAFYGFRAALATIGLLANCSIVYVTAKSRSLREVCNILVATESSLAILQDASYSIGFSVVLSGVTFVRYEACFWALLPCAVLSNTAQAAMVLTGLDRLCAVLFPLWYHRRDKKQYLVCVAFALSAYATYWLVLYLIDYQNSKDVMVTCSTEEMGQGGLGALMKITGWTLSGTLLSSTWLLVLQLRTLAQNVNVTETNRRFIKSILLLAALNLVGVFTKTGVGLVFTYHLVNAFVSRTFTLAMSCFVVLVYSANAPVLYIVSDEYRNKFNKHFKWLPRLFGLKVSNAVVASTPFNLSHQPAAVQQLQPNSLNRATTAAHHQSRMMTAVG